MMRDTSKIVGEYLRIYKKAGVRVANLKSQLETLQAELSIIDAPIAAYEEKHGGHGGECSPVEMVANNRHYMTRQAECIEREIIRLEAFSRMMENALAALNDDDRKIVTLFYLEGETMEEVAGKVYMTRKGAACRKQKIVDDLYYMMGGDYDTLITA